MRGLRFPFFLFLLVAFLTSAGVHAAELGERKASGVDRAIVSTGEVAGLFAPSTCVEARGIAALSGPGDSCCERHAAFCESLCTCGISWFNCASGSGGGCTSSCKCYNCV
jgi:hypothetical protein